MEVSKYLIWNKIIEAFKSTNFQVMRGKFLKFYFIFSNEFQFKFVSADALAFVSHLLNFENTDQS